MATTLHPQSTIKLADSLALEVESLTWKESYALCLQPGQLLFTLTASSDTFPTTMNKARWKIPNAFSVNMG